MLSLVAPPADPVFTPAIGTAARLVMGKIVPCRAVGAVVFANRSPLPFAQVGSPAPPRLVFLHRLFKPGSFPIDRRLTVDPVSRPGCTWHSLSLCVYGSANIGLDMICSGGAQLRDPSWKVR